MNALKSLLSLAALLLAAPAMTQDLDAMPQKKKIVLTVDAGVDAPGTDFALVALSLTHSVVRIKDAMVLSDASVHLLTKKFGRFVLDMDVPADWSADLYWQGATWDATNGLRWKPIRRLDADATKADATDADRKSPSKEVLNADALQALNKPILKPTPIPKYPPLSFQLERGKSGDDCRLHAQFVAPTDDYGLGLVRVESGGSIRRADVYLYRKVPGRGEGMNAIKELHSLTIALPGVKSVRVLLAEGTSSRPDESSPWNLVAYLTK